MKSGVIIIIRSNKTTKKIYIFRVFVLHLLIELTVNKTSTIPTTQTNTTLDTINKLFKNEKYILKDTHVYSPSMILVGINRPCFV